MAKRKNTLEQMDAWMNGISKMEINKPKNRYVEAMCAYRHYKGSLYYVVGTAFHSETGEEMVVYHALYGDCQMYVRPLEMFLEEAPEGKENPTGQKYRFELVSNI